MWCNLIFPNISMTSIRYQTKNKLSRVFFGFLENELCYLTFFSLVWYCSSMIQSSFPQTYWSITKKTNCHACRFLNFQFYRVSCIMNTEPELNAYGIKNHITLKDRVRWIETCFLIKANYFSTWRTILIYLIWLKPVSI